MDSRWTDIANKLGFADERTMWERLYKDFSLSQLAEKVGVSQQTIRYRLALSGIDLKKRGGANNQKIHLTEDLINDVVTLGVCKAAKKHGVKPQTLYTRLYYKYGLTLAKLRSAVAEGSVQPGTPSPSSPEGGSEQQSLPPSPPVVPGDK